MNEFKILSLDNIKFRTLCRELRERVEKSGFIADAVLPVPRGGLYIQKEAWDDKPSIELIIERPKRFSLKKHVSWLLKLLPMSLLDRVRIWDAHRLVKRTGHMRNSKLIVPDIPAEIKRVIVIDDAIDSGATLKAVMTALHERYPHIEFRSTVLSVTSNSPIYIADYYLYNNSTLIRMPWSIDAK